MDKQKTGRMRFGIHNGDIIGGDKISQSGVFSTGVDKRKIVEKNNFIEITTIANELQRILNDAEMEHPISNVSDKMIVANQAYTKAKSDPKLMKKIYLSLKAGGLGALEQALEHPAASFLINALKEWQENSRKSEL